MDFKSTTALLVGATTLTTVIAEEAKVPQQLPVELQDAEKWATFCNLHHTAIANPILQSEKIFKALDTLFGLPQGYHNHRAWNQFRLPEKYSIKSNILYSYLLKQISSNRLTLTRMALPPAKPTSVDERVKSLSRRRYILQQLKHDKQVDPFLIEVATNALEQSLKDFLQKAAYLESSEAEFISEITIQKLETLTKELADKSEQDSSLKNDLGLAMNMLSDFKQRRDVKQYNIKVKKAVDELLPILLKLELGEWN